MANVSTSNLGFKYDVHCLNIKSSCNSSRETYILLLQLGTAYIFNIMNTCIMTKVKQNVACVQTQCECVHIFSFWPKPKILSNSR